MWVGKNFTSELELNSSDHKYFCDSRVYQKTPRLKMSRDWKYLATENISHFQSRDIFGAGYFQAGYFRVHPSSQVQFQKISTVLAENPSAFREITKFLELGCHWRTRRQTISSSFIQFYFVEQPWMAELKPAQNLRLHVVRIVGFIFDRKHQLVQD